MQRNYIYTLRSVYFEVYSLEFLVIWERCTLNYCPYNHDAFVRKQDNVAGTLITLLAEFMLKIAT